MKYEIIDNFINLSGVVDSELIELFKDNNYDISKLYYIDMSKVDSVSFEAIRIFVDKYNIGYKFMLVRCNDDILLYLHDTGLSSLLNIMGDFKEIDLNEYDYFGGGFWGKSYKSKDGLKMIKIYDINFEGAKIECYKEKASSLSLMRLKLLSPLTSNLVKAKEGYGIVYEYMKNKISYSRLVERDSDNDEKLKEHSTRMAKLVRKLHKTECDTRVFMSAKELYRDIIETIPKVTDEMKNKFYSDLEKAEDGTTCIHGDFQFGNVIFSEGRDIFIDLPEFSYGSPYFDLGSMYAVCHSINEDFIREVYHNEVKTFEKAWYYFVRAYFETEDNDIIQKEEKKILLYARLRIARFMQGVCENDMYRDFYNSFLDK